MKELTHCGEIKAKDYVLINNKWLQIYFIRWPKVKFHQMFTTLHGTETSYYYFPDCEYYPVIYLPETEEERLMAKLSCCT